MDARDVMLDCDGYPAPDRYPQTFVELLEGSATTRQFDAEEQAIITSKKMLAKRLKALLAKREAVTHPLPKSWLTAPMRSVNEKRGWGQSQSKKTNSRKTGAKPFFLTHN